MEKDKINALNRLLNVTYKDGTIGAELKKNMIFVKITTELLKCMSEYEILIEYNQMA